MKKYLAILAFTPFLLCAEENLEKNFSQDSALISQEESTHNQQGRSTATNKKLIKPQQNISAQPQLVSEASPFSSKTENMDTSSTATMPPTFLMSASPQFTGDVAFNVRAEFLYWKRNSGFQVAADGVGISSTFTNQNVPNQGNTHFLSSNFNPGFRVGIGLDFAHDGWDVQAIYTWWHSKKNWQQTASNPNQGAMGVNFIQDLNSFWTSTYTNIQYAESLTFNSWDLNLGRNFYISPYLTVRPCIGVASLYIPASMQVNMSLTNSTASYNDISQFKSYGHSLSFGTKLGFETEWYFAQQFSVRANYFLSLLWSRYHTQAKDYLTTLTANYETINQKNHSYSDVTMWQQLFLGLSWDTFLNKGKSQLQFYAGWEFNKGITNSYNSTGIALEGLSIQGLTLGGKFDF